MYKTVFTLKDVNPEEVSRVMSSIEQVDNTFKWNVENRKYGKFLIILSEDKDTAMKRGTWLRNSVDVLENTYFSVEDGD